MPRGREFTLRAKMPAATPATNPLIVDPKMIPANCARTAGVNQADPPSIAPNNAPSRSPSSTLFITSSVPICLLPFFTTCLQISLALSVHKKQNQDAHRQVRCNQQDKEPIAAVKTPHPFKNPLPGGSDPKTLQITRKVHRHFLDSGKAT